MIIGAIVGATGVGKTELGIQLAERLGAEIISADSRQIYRAMAIGTAQPNLEQLARVKHHLVGFLDPQENYSVAAFLADVHRIVENNPQKKFLVVGGTGLYIQALQEGLSEMPPVEPQLRLRLEKVLARRGLPFMEKWARQVDPVGALALKPGDTHRTLRALEVFLQTRKPLSELQGHRLGAFPTFPVLWFDREREELYARIDLRVKKMLAEGWLEETRALCSTISGKSAAMSSLGYRNLGQILAGEGNIQSATEKIQQETRNFAKRQLTWFRNKTPSTKIILSESGEIDQISAIGKYFEK